MKRAYIPPNRLRFGLAGSVVILALTIVLASFLAPLPVAQAITTIPVTTNADSGSGSLREAIQIANGTATIETITFSLPPANTTINLNSALPAITKQVTIDATSQTGYTGAPLIELNGAGAGAGANGLEVNLNDHTIIKGLVINNFSGSGIFIYGSAAHNTTITNCYIGTDLTGTIAKPNTTGIYISGASSTTIGDGTTTGISNIISGNTTNGIYVYGPDVNTTSIGTHIYNNYIGLGSGGAALANGTGIRLEGAVSSLVGDRIGVNYRNIISGNTNDGVLLTGSLTTGNQVMSNLIGVNINGSSAIPNKNGIRLDGAGSNIIGGSVSGMRNIISGNTNNGVYLLNSGATGNAIQANYIGLDTSGANSLPNSDGIRLENAPGNTIGFNSALTRNVISGNTNKGVLITGSQATQNIIQGNYIGTNSAGTLARPNTDGVVINEGLSNVVGATGSGEGNVISGNTGHGVLIISTISGASSNKVQQNYIGLSADGSTAIANNFGVDIEGANSNTVGGSLVGGYLNVISGNTTSGVTIAGAGASSNIVRGDYIGLDKTGKIAVANGKGIVISSAPSNVLGGSDNNYRNFIAGNSGSGIEVSGAGATANEARNNQIGLKSDFTTLKNGGRGIWILNGGQLKLLNNNVVRT